MNGTGTGLYDVSFMMGKLLNNNSKRLLLGQKWSLALTHDFNNSQAIVHNDNFKRSHSKNDLVCRSMDTMQH